MPRPGEEELQAVLGATSGARDSAQDLQPAEEGGDAMKPRWIVVLATALALTATLSAPTLSPAQTFHTATLNARQEVLTVFSFGTGTFQALIREGDTAIDYLLAYNNLSGTVTQAHIHFGKEFEQGGIVVFLCSNLTPPPVDLPANTPPCPVPSGTVTGTLDATSVINRAAPQGINTGDFNKLLIAFRLGFTYANVHSNIFPGGEIRGQVR
jgi:hypothetical protein